jgi:hypothetical protein
MFCYLLLFIHHKHHVTLMHSWYSSSAYACNRCTGGRDFARIRWDELGSSRDAIGVGWKHLLHWYPIFVHILLPWILCSSGLSRLLSPVLSGRSRVIFYHLRAIGFYIWHDWLYLLLWKRTWYNLNKDRMEAYRFVMTMSVSLKDRFLEPFFVMLNTCLSLS